MGDALLHRILLFVGLIIDDRYRIRQRPSPSIKWPSECAWSVPELADCPFGVGNDMRFRSQRRATPDAGRLSTCLTSVSCLIADGRPSPKRCYSNFQAFFSNRRDGRAV
jgi:hypothetical protein